MPLVADPSSSWSCAATRVERGKQDMGENEKHCKIFQTGTITAQCLLTVGRPPSAVNACVCASIIVVSHLLGLRAAEDRPTAMLANVPGNVWQSGRRSWQAKPRVPRTCSHLSARKCTEHTRRSGPRRCTQPGAQRSTSLGRTLSCLIRRDCVCRI